MRKGITPVLAVILLLIITVAVVGMGYGFIAGFIGEAVSKVAIVNGLGSCKSGNVTIFLTNGGQGNIDLRNGTGGVLTGDVTVIRTSEGSGEPEWGSFNPDGPCTAGSSCILKPGESGKLQEVGTTGCGTGTCQYDVVIGGVTHRVRADCF